VASVFACRGCNAFGQLGFDAHTTILEQLRRANIAMQGVDEPNPEEVSRMAELPAECVLTPYRVTFFDTAKQEHPTDEPTQLSVDDVACGEAFTVVIADKRRSVWSFGCGEAGQLGVDEICAKSCVPRCILRSTEIPAPEIRARTLEQVPVADQLFSSASCGPEQACIVTNSGAVYLWGTGISPQFSKFADDLSVESGQCEVVDTKKPLFRKSPSRSKRKGAPIVFAHTLDASERQVTEAAPDAEFSTHVGLEAGVVPKPVQTKDRKPYEPSPEEAIVLAVAESARQRGFWKCLEDREKYRKLMKEQKDKEREALKKWIYLGGGPVARFLEVYKGGGTNDVCFTPFESGPDRDDPDKPAKRDSKTLQKPTLVVSPTTFPILESVVCGSRFGFALLRGPDANRCDILSATSMSPEAVDALVDAKFAVRNDQSPPGVTGTDGIKVLDNFLSEYRPPVPTVLSVECGEEIVLEVQVPRL
jgi:hypothetical protein